MLRPVTSVTRIDTDKVKKRLFKELPLRWHAMARLPKSCFFSLFTGKPDPDLPVVRATHRALATVGSLEEAGHAVLEAVGDSLGWLVGLMWLTDPADEQLYLLTAWRARVHEADQFEMLSRQLVFRRGEGMPGRVWETGKLVYEEDVLSTDYFRRTNVARAEGLHAALAFPLRRAERVIGVMEFYTNRLWAPVAVLAGTFQAIGDEVGARLHLPATTPFPATE